MDDEEVTSLEAVERLTRDTRKATATMSAGEARFLVDAYYSLQDYRIQSANQVRALSTTGEPHAVLAWLATNTGTLEKQVQAALDSYSLSKREGRWARSVYGIGPVIAAGLLAHIDPARAHTAGAIWRLAGLDPSVIWPSQSDALTWLKASGSTEDHEGLLFLAAKHFGRNVDTLRRHLERSKASEKSFVADLSKALAMRPWVAQLKVLAWKMGDCFRKFSGRDECFYGHVYRERKALEVERNESGALAEQAAAKLQRAKDGKHRISPEMRAAWEGGKLQPAGVDARAARYAVKLFLAHYQHVIYSIHRGTPPKPYVLEHVAGHVHMIEPPGWPCD